MKRLLAAMLAVTPLSATVAPVESRAYRWSETSPEQHGDRVMRRILSGSTLDLESLTIHAATMPANGAPDSGSVRTDAEQFLMVKDGELQVTMNGVGKVLGRGSVAVVMPGDRQIVANVGRTPATFYLFTYRSKAPADQARARMAGGSFMVDRRDLVARKTASGSRRDVLNRPTAMFKRFEAHFTSVNEGLQNHATHSHRAEEIIMLIEGDVRVLVDSQYHPASNGDLVFLGTRTRHSLVNSGRGPTEYLVIQGE